MTTIKLTTKYIEKPWGRTQIPAIFPNPDGRQIGEIWFDGPEGERPPLLVKYIFTSERLSIQVHPNDAEAKERGLPGGKEECWYILEAEPDARLGVGLNRHLNGEELRTAALDGSIEQLMDWKPVQAGDFFFIPAGTVHAIGAGITLVEVQQNVDVTYRLYDYGRPRELHLEDGVAVSKAEPYAFSPRNISLGSNAQLMPGKPFALEMKALDRGTAISLSGTSWFIPLSGSGELGGKSWRGSECWYIQDAAELTVAEKANALIARI
ncbi:class I mannose-6-phosphate isomerase [Rhizorhapis suberifaciens]|uniref:Mannose-6-phosphate isomerase n=1 Tax=Rhizorhapis suberifaciens TaxID=13656 RepID=A0A840HRE8_9SPHN|nr:class I mannose-6-phosphate isomerase [Rhizorhapis suberifaciens]MBB4640124.1 mannose-6-phosphate isomerase [Rhizorhapis suberifaciens]